VLRGSILNKHVFKNRLFDDGVVEMNFTGTYSIYAV